MAHYIQPKIMPSESGIYEFRKTIHVQKSGKFIVNIFAALRYSLYINDKYICEGPCRSDAETRYFDTVSYTLNQGSNDICVKVLHQTKNFTTVFKTEKPMLILDISSNSEHFETDKSWKCYFLNNHKLFYPEGHSSFLHPCEEINAKHFETALEVEEYFFLENINLDFSKDCSLNMFGIELLPPLEKRPIPMIYPNQEISFKIIASGNGFIELDAGRYTTAKVIFEIAKNTDMKIIYAECYEFQDGKKRRDDTSGFLNGYFDMFHTFDKDFSFEPFWFRAFRYIRIESDNPLKALKSIKAFRCTYPLDITGSFFCSDENYNKMVEVSQNTLLCCMHEIFVDCPYYEQQQYIMDAAIESAVLKYMSSDLRMVRKCLEEFAASQHKNGLLSANYPSTYVQIIPGFSLFWIFFLKDYLEYSADIEFAKKYTGVMDKILLFFDNQIDKHGYVTASAYWDFVDWVPVWPIGTVPLKNGEAITIYNLYYAYALKCAAYICSKVGRDGLAEEYKNRYASIRETINERCYDKRKGMYRDGSETSSFSSHTIIWAIISEVIPKESEAGLASHLFDKDINRCSFSMNYYLFRALEKCGMYDKAISVLSDWQKMLDLNCTTWCENPDSPRSECHAWSCAPLHEFSSNILGVKHSFENIIIIKPIPCGLKFAKGVVPTRFGLVSVDWQINESGFKIRIESPENIEKQLTLPNGEEYVFTEKTFII